MRHFGVFIAILLALASVLGASTANAHRYVSAPIVVLNHVDGDNKPIPVFVEVQRGQVDLGAGLVMPCGPHHGIEASVPALPMRNGTEASPLPCSVGSAAWRVVLPLRPPIAA